MNDYWIEAGFLWTQIVKAIYRSGKVLTISKEGISIDGGTHMLHTGGVITIDEIESILRESL